MAHDRQIMQDIHTKYRVVGGGDNLCQAISEHRYLEDIRKKKKAIRRTSHMFVFKDNEDIGEQLPVFCIVLPHVGMVTCYEKYKE